MGLRAVRWIAGVGLSVTAAGVIYVLCAISGWQPSWAAWAQAVLHLGELAVVLALVGSLSPGVLGRTGGVLATLGQALLTTAEVVFPSAPDVGDVLFGLGPLLSGVGMICLGVEASRSSPSPWRVLPLLVGVWILVPTTPILVATGGPPDVAALAAIGLWDLLWAATATFVASSTSSRARAPMRPTGRRGDLLDRVPDDAA